MFYFKQLKAILWLQGGVKRENGELTVPQMNEQSTQLCDSRFHSAISQSEQALDYLDELTLEESEGARKQQKQLTANKNSIRKKQTNKKDKTNKKQKEHVSF